MTAPESFRARRRAARMAAGVVDVQADIRRSLGLHPEQSLALLQALHILTRDGRINQDSRRKLKQVQHLCQFITPLLQECARDGHSPTLADHGAGKSYLGFILHDLCLRPLGRGHIWGIETRAELVDASRALAQRPERFDVVTALHACDTATDDAIAFALDKCARALVLVPCCQAEVAAHLRRGKALQLTHGSLAELWRHPLHTREMGSHLTNVLRCLYLQANGYQVTVTELVGWEHSMKNELILARYDGQRRRSAARRMQELLLQFGLQALVPVRYPRLPDLLQGDDGPGAPGSGAATPL